MVSALTPTPGPTPRNPHLTYGLTVDPEQPRVGDSVRLRFAVGIDGGGGLPQYTLSVNGGVLSGNVGPITHSGPLPDTVVFTLDAIAAGEAELRLRVNYEAALTVGGQCCVFHFVNDESPPFRVPVLATGGATPTPTATIVAPQLHRVTVRVGLGKGACPSGYPDRTVELFPTGRTAQSDGEGIAVFDAVADGDYELRVVPPCASGSCFPYEPIRVAGDDSYTELCPPLCTPQLYLDPESGPPGTEVAVEGACQYIHSGGMSPLLFGPIAAGSVTGQTAGDFHELFTVPYVPPGAYPVRAADATALFEVTGDFPGCDGDCNGDLEVRIDELTRAVGIALATVNASLCPVFRDGATVAQLVRAVRAALQGCAAVVPDVPTPPVPATGTATRTGTPTPTVNPVLGSSPTPTRTVAVNAPGVDLFPVRAAYARCQLSGCSPLPADGVTVCVGNRGVEDAGPFLVAVSGRAPIEVDGVPSGLEACFELLLTTNAEVSVDVGDSIAEANEENNDASFPAPVGTQCDVIEPTCAPTPTPTPGPLENLPCEQCCADCTTQECLAECAGHEACDLVAEWSGVVTDLFGGQPIARAEVTVNGAVVRTNHSGDYSITSVREEICTGLDYPYELSVRAPGYQTFVESFYRVPLPRRTRRDVELLPNAETLQAEELMHGPLFGGPEV